MPAARGATPRPAPLRAVGAFRARRKGQRRWRKGRGRALLEFCDPRPEWEVEGLNEEQLAEKLAARTGMTKRDAMDALNTTLDTIAASLKKGEKVTLVGFGTFLVRRRSPPAGGGSRSSSPSSLSSPSRYC